MVRLLFAHVNAPRTWEEISGTVEEMRYIPMPLVFRSQPFDGDEWFFELKYDGWRSLAYVQPDGVTWSRARPRLQEVRAAGARSPTRAARSLAVLDGEIVCLDDAGRPCFMDLMRQHREPIFVGFDVLTHGTTDVRWWPLWRRKKRLRSLVPPGASSILYADSIAGRGVALYAEAYRHDSEGIVAKGRDSPHNPTRQWIKIKNPSYTQKVGRHEFFNAKRR